MSLEASLDVTNDYDKRINTGESTKVIRYHKSDVASVGKLPPVYTFDPIFLGAEIHTGPQRDIQRP